MNTRKKALQIFNAGVAAVQPSRLIPGYLDRKDGILYIFNQQFLIKDIQNIYIIGAGKASAAMAKTVEDVLGDLITGGLVVTKYDHALPLGKVECLEAGHPVPDARGIAATAKTLGLLRRSAPNDIIICLISGGASSLWIDIPEGISLKDIQETFELLLKCGASIDEVNIIRKQLSLVKGGKLPGYAPDADWFSFIISDVPGDSLSVIASGPTVPDTHTFADAKAILEKYNLTLQLPLSIINYINAGTETKVDKALKKNQDAIFTKVHNQVIGNNYVALEAARAAAIQLGYRVAHMNGFMNGNADTVARGLISLCKNYTGILPACFLFGGETTVTVTGNGKGGRNQQMALAALLELSAAGIDLPYEITFLSAGTDGTDGPTDAAGAMADKLILSIANQKNLDPAKYLDNHDAYHFFGNTGGLIKTGATQTNVMDLVIILLE